MLKVDIKKELLSAEGKVELKIEISANENDFITIFGKSGVGKTTLLRILAGLSDAKEGFISVDDEIWLDTKKGINIPPQKRKIGFVFQDYALFPNMTIRKNLEYALENSKNKSFVNEIIEITGLKELSERKPDTLSGGQKQRVALARALVRRPKILLLDEPLSALDSEMRLKLQNEIYKLHKNFNITTLMVSHDVSEVFKLSDKVFIIDNGKIAKSGTPSQVFIEEKISGKFKFTGEIVEIKKSDIVFIVTILVTNHFIRVIATEEEIEDLKTGDRVIVASKAFNPIIIKI